MRKVFVCCIALLVAGALSPAWAGTLYVPVVKSANGITQTTEVFVSNSASAARNFSTLFLKADTDGTARQGVLTPTSVAGNGSLRIGSGAPATEVGLLEVNAATEMGVDARLVSTSANGTTVTRLPMISSANAGKATATLNVLGLEHSDTAVTDLMVVNLGFSAAQCEVKLYKTDGTTVVAPATVPVKALSARLFPDVFGLVGQTQISDVRAQVSCNQVFYTYAVVHQDGGARMAFLTPAATGLSTLTNKPETDRPLPAGTKLLFERKGEILTPSRSKEVFEENIPVPKAMALKRMVIELDFKVGPWATRDNGGPHAIIWLYRGTFRSNTIANVNVHGPNKNKIRMNQNVDLPGLSDTLAQQGGQYEQGKTYHFTYTYDAEHNRVTCVVTQGSTVINNLEFGASAARRTLSIPASGVDYVLGHRSGLEFEVPSYGWTYSNMRVAIAEY